MSPVEETVEVRTPTPGKKTWRVSKWKYEAVRSAILRVVPKNNTGVEFKELPTLVAKQLSPADRKKLGSVEWYTTSVKLDMEVKREIERIEGTVPQRLRRVK